MQTFSPEIFDIIISYLDDYASLHSCSLVCRAWLPASRTATYAQPIEVVVPVNKPTTLRIQRLVQSPFSTLRTYLKRISIQAPYSNPYSEERQKDAEQCTTLVNGIIHANLQLEEVAIEWPDDSLFPERTFAALITHSRSSLHTLKVSVTDTTLQLLRAISSCTLLQNTTLSFLQNPLAIYLPAQPDVPLPPAPASLKTVELISADCSMLYTWLVPCPQLSVLKLPVSDANQLDALTSFLGGRSTIPALHLEMNFCDDLRKLSSFVAKLNKVLETPYGNAISELGITLTGSNWDTGLMDRKAELLGELGSHNLIGLKVFKLTFHSWSMVTEYLSLIFKMLASVPRPLQSEEIAFYLQDPKYETHDAVLDDIIDGYAAQVQNLCPLRVVVDLSQCRKANSVHFPRCLQRSMLDWRFDFVLSGSIR